MTSVAPRRPYPIPPMIVVSCLVALAAFYISSGGSWLLPIFGVAIVVSQFVPFRVNNISAAGLLLRVGVLTLVAVVAATGRETKLMDAFVLAPALDFVTHCFAAEMAVEMWLEWPPSRGRTLVFLASLVFFGGCATSFPYPMIILAPVFFACLLTGIRQFTVREEHIRPASRLVVRLVALAMVIAAGSFAQFQFRMHKDDITSYALEKLGPMAKARDAEPDGIDKSPHLSSSFDIPSSAARLLKIEGPIDDPHLHGVSFDTYESGHWKPDFEQRAFRRALTGDMHEGAEGKSAMVTRYVDDDGMIPAPVNCAGVKLPPTFPIPSIATDFSTMKAGAAPYQYQIIASERDNFQGPYAQSLTPQDRERYLRIPISVGTGLSRLTASVAPPSLTPAKRIQAIVAFLMTNNHYSTKAKIGEGEPVVTFVLQRKSAHCEYFGSASTLMLRLAGIPARYVIGYYAHETDGAGTTTVRGQDAHAWSEAWLDGVGWVTVDATPAGGRPDRTGGHSPLWAIRDKFQDIVTWFQLNVAHATTAARVYLIAAVVVLIVGFGAWQVVQARRNRVRPQSYSQVNKALSDLAARFESMLARRGGACPANVPWSEHLRTLPATAKIDEALAERFVGHYTVLRFRHAILTSPPQVITNQDLDDLRAMMSALEKDSK
jgi:hypothetical protein